MEMNKNTITQLKEELSAIKERLSAIEREQRFIQHDILSGNPKENMQRRLLNSTTEKPYHQKKEKINDEIKIEI
jgi:hypothetical protein